MEFIQTELIVQRVSLENITTIQAADLNAIISGISNPNNKLNVDYSGLKQRLNSAKQLLDKLVKLKYYNQFMAALDVYFQLKYEQKSKLQHVSNAWLKCFELLVRFCPPDMLRSLECAPDTIRTTHIAELPGSFIYATHQYLIDAGFKHEFYFSSIVGEDMKPFNDEYGLVAKYTDRFISAFRGDLSDPNLPQYIIDTDYPKSAIVTGDLGMDVSENYDEQEKINMRAQFGQDIAMLAMLKSGGIFISKHYTLFEPFNISLVAVLNLLFKEFYICKPLTSRQRNSETYLVGIGYIPNDQIISAMIENMKYGDAIPLMDDSIGGEYLREIKNSLININTILAMNQINYLKYIDKMFAKYSTKTRNLYQDMEQIRKPFISNWKKINHFDKCSDLGDNKL